MADETLQVVITAKDQTGGVLSGLSGTVGNLGKLAGGVLTLGLGAAAAGGTALAAGLYDSVQEAMKSEEVIAQLGAVLKSTGGAAGVTEEMATGLADKLDDVTRFEDEAILSGENMLLTFTNIGKDVFPDATQSMLDMATALGQDPVNSAMMLGKALNDPVQGVTALRRVGVQLTDDQEALIKKMVESGDVMGAQKVILGELTKEFGGSAVAAGQTAAGQFDIFNNKVGNIKEEIGNKLLPIMGTLLDKFGPVLLDVISGALPIMDGIISAFDNLGKNVDTVLGPFEPLMTAVKNLLSAFQESSPLMGEEIDKIREFLVEGLGPSAKLLIDNITSAFNSLAALWREHADEIIPALGFAFNLVATVVMGAINLIVGIVSAGLKLLQGDWQGAGEVLFNTIDTILESIAGLFGTTLDGIRAQWQLNWDMLVMILSTIGDRVNGAIGGAFNGIRDGIYNAMINAANTVLGFMGYFGYLGNLVIDGLVNGLWQNIWKVHDFFTGMINEIIGNVKNMLGIHSPSSLFADFGKQMMVGWQQGLNVNMSGPVGAVSAAATGMAMAAQTTNNRFYGPISVQAPNDGSLTALLQSLQTAAGA